MLAQTISLFRYLMRGILSRRLLALIGVLLLVAIVAASFIGELAMINSVAIIAAFIADFLRYGLTLLILLLVISSVSEDFESKQFERLLAMPIARWQYIAAQTLVIVCLCLLAMLPVFVVTAIVSSPMLAVYWAAALALEMFLVGVIALLAIMSFEKITLAVFFSLAIVLLAKLSTLIGQMLAESIHLSDGSVTSRTVEFIFSAILTVLPSVSSFADSDAFFGKIDLLASFGTQILSVSICALFLLAVCLVDFYRKEFNT